MLIWYLLWILEFLTGCLLDLKKVRIIGYTKYCMFTWSTVNNFDICRVRYPLRDLVQLLGPTITCRAANCYVNRERHGDNAWRSSGWASVVSSLCHVRNKTIHVLSKLNTKKNSHGHRNRPHPRSIYHSLCLKFKTVDMTYVVMFHFTHIKWSIHAARVYECIIERLTVPVTSIKTQ